LSSLVAQKFLDLSVKLPRARERARQRARVPRSKAAKEESKAAEEEEVYK